MITAPEAIKMVLPAVAAGALAYGAVTDLRRYIIPNVVSLFIAAAFVAMALVMPLAFGLGGLAVGAVLLVAGFFVFSRGWLGGGDVKLLAALGLWSGPTFGPGLLLVTCASGAVLAVIMLSPVVRFLPPPPATAAAAVGKGSATGVRRPMPYGLAIAVGGFWVLAHYFAAAH